MKIFTIHDTKAETFLPPINFRNNGEALRAFETTVNDDKTQFHAYPEDYNLIQIGSYDENTGILTTDAHVRLANGTELIKTK